MSNIKILRSKIIEQIENVIYEEEKADDVKICVKKDKVKVTLNNNKPFYIYYKDYSKKKILNDNDCWLKLVKKSIKKELKKSSHKELYTIHLVDGFDLGDLEDIAYLQIKAIYSEIRAFFCYATENEMDKFMISNQGKVNHELNDITEIPDDEREQIEDINEEIDGDRSRSISISRSRSLGPQPHIKRIGALDKTENINYPSNLFVFVLDSGVYKKHKDLNINTQYSKDFTGSPLGWDDSNGHGTHVSGTIGAKDSTFAVAPGVQIIMHKVLRDNGRGDTEMLVDSLNEIKKFKENNPSAKIVVSMSLGQNLPRKNAGPYINGNVSKPPKFLIQEVIIRKLIKEGITFIVAAGNETTDTSVFIPSRIPEAITVGAYGYGYTGSTPVNDNSIAIFSNFGSLIDIMAPGVKIYSTWHGYVTNDNGVKVDSSNTTVYNTISGTSMAAPIVTGAVVNMIAVEAMKNPNKILTPQEIKNRLRSDAENSYAANTNEKIKMVNPRKDLCWASPSEFKKNDCYNWWFNPTVNRRNGNIIALSSLDQTYPYSVYIGRYTTKDGNLIENY
jgi:hypothetical protein